MICTIPPQQPSLGPQSISRGSFCRGVQLDGSPCPNHHRKSSSYCTDNCRLRARYVRNRESILAKQRKRLAEESGKDVVDKFCRECGARLRSDNESGYCKDHLSTANRPSTTPKICCVEGCGKTLQARNTRGWCRLHLTRESRGERPRVCAEPGCKNVIGWEAAAEQQYCRHHRDGHRRKMPKLVCAEPGCDKPLKRGPGRRAAIERSEQCYCHFHSVKKNRTSGVEICAETGCEKRLDQRNQTGYCSFHSIQKNRLSDAQFCKHDGCGKRLQTGHNKSGYCRAHRPETSATLDSRRERAAAQWRTLRDKAALADRLSAQQEQLKQRRSLSPGRREKSLEEQSFMQNGSAVQSLIEDFMRLFAVPGRPVNAKLRRAGFTGPQIVAASWARNSRTPRTKWPMIAARKFIATSKNLSHRTVSNQHSRYLAEIAKVR